MSNDEIGFLMRNKANNYRELSGLEKFKQNAISKLQNLSLYRLNPMFDQWRCSGDDYSIHIDFPVINFPVPKDAEPTTWTAWSKERFVVERSDKQTKYRIHRLFDVPFYIRMFIDAARESFKYSIVFVSDGLHNELRVYVYPRNKHLKSKSEDLLTIAERLLGVVKKAKKQKVEYICRNYSFKAALDEILTLSKQPIDTNLSYCLACGDVTKRGNKFCESGSVHNSKTRVYCRDNFHNWLRRRLEITGGIEKERKEVERLYEELQHILQEKPFSAFDVLKSNHSELYDERRRGPKKRG